MMRHFSAMVAVPILFLIGCEQGPDQDRDPRPAETDPAAQLRLCQAVSGSITGLDDFLGRMGQINLCLQGVSDCPTEKLVEKACDARDSLADFHQSYGCTDRMLGPRPGVCDRV